MLAGVGAGGVTAPLGDAAALIGEHGEQSQDTLHLTVCESADSNFVGEGQRLYLAAVCPSL